MQHMYEVQRTKDKKARQYTKRVRRKGKDGIETGTELGPEERRLRAAVASCLNNLWRTAASCVSADAPLLNKTLLRLLLFHFLMARYARSSANAWEKHLQVYGDMSTDLDPAEFVIVPLPDAASRPRTQPEAFREASKYLRQGKIHKAWAALDEESTPPVPINPARFTRLATKHPQAEFSNADMHNQPPPRRCNQTPSARVYEQNIIDAICATRIDVAAGPYGWPIKTLRDLLGPDIDEARSNPPPVVRGLTKIAMLACDGKSRSIAPLRAATLIALPKPNGDVRPVAIGSLLLNVPLKAVAKSYSGTNASRANTATGTPANGGPVQLLPEQYGCASKGGVEVPIHVARAYISRAVEEGWSDNMHITALDTKNAFNTIKRKAVIAGIQDTSARNKHLLTLFKTVNEQPSALVCDGVEADEGQRATRGMHSTTGVRQGDPTSPMFFLLGTRARGKWLSKMLEGHTAIWFCYLDDVYIISVNEPTLVHDIETHWSDSTFHIKPPDDGLELNPSKTQTKTATAAWAEGFEMLGSVVGSPAAEAAFMRRIVSKIMDRLDTLRSLPSRHDAFCLFRETWMPMLTHHLRCIPIISGPARRAPGTVAADGTDVNVAADEEHGYGLSELQAHQEDFLDMLRGNTRAQRHTTTVALERLPVRYGGIGATCAMDITTCAYSASLEMAAYVWKKRNARTPAPMRGALDFALVGDGSKPPTPQHERITRDVLALYNSSLDEHHDIPGPINAMDRTDLSQDPHRYERQRHLERKSKLGRAWLRRGAPGVALGHMRLSNTSFQMALAQTTGIVIPDEGACDTCGMPRSSMEADVTPDAAYTQHQKRCQGWVQVLVHTRVNHAVHAVVSNFAQTKEAAEAIKLEPHVGTTQAPTAARARPSAKYADLYIPAGVIPGVAAQLIDFKVTRVAHRAARGTAITGPPLVKKNRMTGRWPTAAEWSTLCQTNALQFAHKEKVREYKHVTPLPQAQRAGAPHNVTPVIISSRGLLHADAKAWLDSFPVPLRTAIRTAISFELLLFSNRNVDACLSQTWTQ